MEKVTKWYNLTQEEEQNLSAQQYKAMEIGHPVQFSGTNGKSITVGYVQQKVDGNKNFTGLDAYVVTPERNPDPNKVEDVAILFQGSTGLDKLGDENLRGNALKDWSRNLMEGAAILYDKKGVSDNQAKAAASFLNEVMDHYPNANFYLTGHSKGSMNMQYAMADIAQDTDKANRILRAVGYEGGNMGPVLNDEQFKAVEKIKGRLALYVDKRDPISKINGSRRIGTQVNFVGTEASDLIAQHMWGGYHCNKDGSIQVQRSGAYGGREKVSLTKSGVEALSARLIKIADHYCNQLKEINNNIPRDLEQILEEVKAQAASQLYLYPHLTYDDLLEILSEYRLEQFYSQEEIYRTNRSINQLGKKLAAVSSELKQVAKNMEDLDTIEAGKIKDIFNANKIQGWNTIK